MFRLAVAVAIATATLITPSGPAHAATQNVLDFVQQEQEQTNWCWAAIGNSVAAFHGYRNYSQNQFCNMAFQRPINSGCPNNQASLNEDRTAFRTIGLRNPGQYWNYYLNFAAVIREIDARRPILVRILWKSGGGHMEVIRGYNQQHNTVYWTDPWKANDRYNMATYDYYVSNERWSWTHTLDSVSA
jgi:hypothetical protein